MKVHLNPRHLELTEAIESHVIARFERLEQFGTPLVLAFVVLQKDEVEDPARRYRVRVQLAVAGPDLHAEACSGDLYAAVDEVADRLSRQLRKRKTRLTDKPRSAKQRMAKL